MRTILCILLIGVTGSGAGAAAEPVCEQSEATITSAPGGRLEASVLHRVCETSTGGAAAAVTVYVGASGAALQGERVVAIAVPRSRDEWPRAVWRGDSLLEVWVPNLAQVLEVRPAFRDVQVRLKYCADDPEERERIARHKTDLQEWMAAVTRWNEARKSDPANAGSRPPRPEEPRLAPRACRDADIPGVAGN
jgi:hypothetical protein